MGAMEFTVDLQPEEYYRAMLWHQYADTLGKRINDFVGWGVLVLTPVTIVLLLVLAPDALSIWFWPVAIIAFLYAAYSTLVIRYQIRQQARTLLQNHPLLASTHYQVHAKGVKLVSEGTQAAHELVEVPNELGGETEEQEKPVQLFLPWKTIDRVQSLPGLFLLFVSDETLLIVPERCLPDTKQFRAYARQAGKLS